MTGVPGTAATAMREGGSTQPPASLPTSASNTSSMKLSSAFTRARLAFTGTLTGALVGRLVVLLRVVVGLLVAGLLVVDLLVVVVLLVVVLRVVVLCVVLLVGALVVHVGRFTEF